FKQIRCDTRPASDNDAVGRTHRFLQRRAAEAVALVQVDSGLAKEVQAGRFELVANQNAGHYLLPFAQTCWAAATPAPGFTGCPISCNTSSRPLMAAITSNWSMYPM